MLAGFINSLEKNNLGRQILYKSHNPRKNGIIIILQKCKLFLNIGYKFYTINAQILEINYGRFEDFKVFIYIFPYSSNKNRRLRIEEH